MEISAAVEGLIDEAVVKRLVIEVGAMVGPIYGKQGKKPLRAAINGYNKAARHRPWIVLVDLDQDADCAPNLCRAWISEKSPKLCFRVAVREVEAWLLADRQSIARFLSVPVSRVPTDPESEINPKQTMVNLAAKSKRSSIREDMIPRPGSGRSVGPAYTSRLVEFIQSPEPLWRPNHAANHSQSLQRCMQCLEQLVQREARDN